MLSVHFNGDVIRCPDSEANQWERKKRLDQQGRCKYGIKESNCPVYMKTILDSPKIQPLSKFTRCVMGCSGSCPEYKKLVDRGNKKKTYKINGAIYRKLASSGHYLVNKAKYKTIFITLTFPQYKREVNENEHNEYFSRFMENLRSHYDCEGYVAVRERGTRYNRIHYHVLCAMPFVSFTTINRVWCNTISDICYSSANALQTKRRRAVITNPVGCIRYICKYFSKAKGQQSGSRVVFISNNMLVPPISIRESVDIFLSNFREDVWAKQSNDYVTIFMVTGYNNFSRLLNTVIYPLFECDIGKSGLNYYAKN